MSDRNTEQTAIAAVVQDPSDAYQLVEWFARELREQNDRHDGMYQVNTTVRFEEIDNDGS